MSTNYPHIFVPTPMDRYTHIRMGGWTVALPGPYCRRTTNLGECQYETIAKHIPSWPISPSAHSLVMCELSHFALSCSNSDHALIVCYISHSLLSHVPCSHYVRTLSLLALSCSAHARANQLQKIASNLRDSMVVKSRNLESRSNIAMLTSGDKLDSHQRRASVFQRDLTGVKLLFMLF